MSKIKRPYPFDVERFRRDEGLTLLAFAEAIGKDIKRVEALVEGRSDGLTVYEHSRLCKRFGRGKVSIYYDLTKAITEQ